MQDRAKYFLVKMVESVVRKVLPFLANVAKITKAKRVKVSAIYYAIVCIAGASYVVFAGVVESFKSIAQLLDQAL